MNNDYRVCFVNKIQSYLSGPINISTSAVLVSPGVAVHGTMSITSSEVYFEVDEDHADFKKIDAQVGTKLVGIFVMINV